MRYDWTDSDIDQRMIWTRMTDETSVFRMQNVWIEGRYANYALKFRYSIDYEVTDSTIRDVTMNALWFRKLQIDDTD
jgi:hypothetical protein